MATTPEREENELLEFSNDEKMESEGEEAETGKKTTVSNLLLLSVEFLFQTSIFF